MKASYCRYVLKFKQPAGTSRGTLLEKETYFLKLEDEEFPGHYGLGECAVFRGLSMDDVPNYEECLREVCANIGRDEMSDLSQFPSIKFGLETAIYDFSNGCRRIPFPSDFTEGNAEIRGDPENHCCRGKSRCGGCRGGRRLSCQCNFFRDEVYGFFGIPEGTCRHFQILGNGTDCKAPDCRTGVCTVRSLHGTDCCGRYRSKSFRTEMSESSREGFRRDKSGECGRRG